MQYSLTEVAVQYLYNSLQNSPGNLLFKLCVPSPIWDHPTSSNRRQ